MQEQDNAKLKVRRSLRKRVINLSHLPNMAPFKEKNSLTNGISLQQKLSSIPNSGNGLPEEDCPNPDFQQAVPEVISSNANFLQAILQVISSNANFREAILRVISSNPDFREAILRAFSSYPDFREVILCVISSNPDFQRAVPGVFSSYPDFWKGVSASTSPDLNADKDINQNQIALPSFIEPTQRVVEHVSGMLGCDEMLNVKRIGLRNTALILLQAHNGQSCSHKDLRKLTGLSEGGIAKRMMSLKKRGLIYRTGFKRFVLSEKAQQMLRKALVAKPWNRVR